MLGAAFFFRRTESVAPLQSVCLARHELAKEGFPGGLVAGHRDVWLCILRRRPIDHNLAARAQLFGAQVGKSMSFAAASQNRRLGTGDVHVMNHRRLVTLKFDGDLDVRGGLAAAIFDEHAANKNHIGDFVRGELRVCELGDILSRLPIVERHSRKDQQENRDKEPGPHSFAILAYRPVRGNGPKRLI